jgi:hypothetical protein
VCDEPIATAARSGPRPEICAKPACRHFARAEAYVAAAIRELEAAGDPATADELRELLGSWRRVALARRPR